MIPVTTFAGSKVAVFGLGGSGLASASALFAGGADVVAWDDNSEKVDQAAGTGIPIADLHDVDWSKISALILTPGVPLTHPSPHWAVDLARAAAVDRKSPARARLRTPARRGCIARDGSLPARYRIQSVRTQSIAGSGYPILSPQPPVWRLK